jgi:hypothetical protein
MLYQYWLVGEVAFIVLFFSIIIFILRRGTKNGAGKTSLPETVTGKLWHYKKGDKTGLSLGTIRELQ